jgi:hypothetical protein
MAALGAHPVTVVGPQRGAGRAPPGAGQSLGSGCPAAPGVAPWPGAAPHRPRLRSAAPREPASPIPRGVHVPGACSLASRCLRRRRPHCPRPTARPSAPARRPWARRDDGARGGRACGVGRVGGERHGVRRGILCPAGALGWAGETCPRRGGRCCSGPCGDYQGALGPAGKPAHAEDKQREDTAHDESPYQIGAPHQSLDPGDRWAEHAPVWSHSA